jgi:hypothetical protein
MAYSINIPFLFVFPQGNLLCPLTCFDW